MTDVKRIIVRGKPIADGRIPALTFAVGKAASAPGQVAIEDLRAVRGVVGRAVGAHR